MAETKRPPNSPASKTEMIAFRISPDDLAQLDQLAEKRGLTRTQYITDAALDRLDEQVMDAEQRDREIEDRLQRLERAAFQIQ